MKNKFLIGTVTVFVAIITNIVFLNFFNSSDNKDYDFQRKFSKNEILKFEKSYQKLDNKTKNNSIVFSNKKILEGEDYDFDKQIYNYYFSDYTFQNRVNKKIKFPIDSYINFVDENCGIYWNSKKIYKYDFKTNKTTDTGLKKINFETLIYLDHTSNKYLFFGQIFKKGIYKMGFFTIDFTSKNINESKILSVSKEPMTEMIMKYLGVFQQAESSTIAFTCEKNSKIFLFNNDGTFRNLLSTKDNTPLPQTIKKANNYYCFSRSGMKYTNVGVIMDCENIFVFSTVSKYKDKIIIDQYSKNTLKYVQSYKLNYNNHNSNDIENVFIDRNKIILKFESNYASFTFSRYI